MDDRFKDMYSAPIFQRVGRGDEEAPKADSRFNTATANFELEPGSIDKYGRKVKKSKKKGKYSAKKSEEADEDDKTVQRKKGQPQPKQQTPAEERLDYLTRISRGEVSGSSSDDSDSDDGGIEEADSDSDNDEAFEEEEEEEEGEDDEEEDEEDIPMGDATTRIAIQNCDWDSIKATDLLVVLQSFCPQGSVVNKVTVYPSDYGKEMLAKEAEYGPQAIWEDEDDDDDKSEESDSGSDSGSDDDDNSEGGDSEDKEGSGNGDVYRKIESVAEGAKGKAGDFKRPPGVVGMVLQQELVRQGKARADDVTDDANGGGGSAQMDPERLQSYELQKLKYYFAVAECDTCETANTLYNELDGLEFGHSSMVMDLRFVPDEISFKDREKERRSCATEVPGDYTPSDFIVRVLQQTSFDCSWDQGDQERASKLTNLSKWRELNESDFSQYIAGSSGDEDEDEDHDDGTAAAGSSGSAAQRKTKANNLRRLLLGGDDDGTRSADGSDAGGAFGNDDFFTHDDHDDDGEGGEGMVMSFVPKTAKLLSDAEEGKDGTVSKKNKKDKKKKKDHKNSKSDDDDDEGRSGPSLHDELGLMFAGEGDSDDDVAADLRGKEASRKAKADKKAKKARGKKRKGGGEGEGDAEDGGDSFQIDTSDSRFAALMEGDARFGIDTTSNEFKKTNGMKHILAEQVKRRGSKAARRAGAAHLAASAGGSYDDAAPRGEVSAKDLVQKLKRKSAKASS
jgi:hypothetical protein